MSQVHALPREVTQPRLIQHFLSRYLPRPVRSFLLRHGILSKPPEYDELNKYLRQLKADIETDIRNKTFIPLAGKKVPSSPLLDEAVGDEFVKPIHQFIRRIKNPAQGGDSVSAQIAAVDPKSRVVRNILRTLLQAKYPLILLGDPGTGKTLTLQQTALSLANSEIDKAFPIIPLYVRLGEFHVDGKVGADDVMAYVKRSAPPEIRCYIDDLDNAGRLVILFDGMDEMSRERYNEHTHALSQFASLRMESLHKTKTLFSCRITDFSPVFQHQRLALLPFNRAQIAEYLRNYGIAFPITIDGEEWNLKRLAKKLDQRDLAIEANNPFVLWLLRLWLVEKRTWPNSRVELLWFYNEWNYQNKKHQADILSDSELIFPELKATFTEWERLAYTITTRNRGAAIPSRELHDGNTPKVGQVKNMIRIGKICGILEESFEEREHLIRFTHHRFQEYFAARYIHNERPQVSWLNKLDAPRWQEMMLNLILMNDESDATNYLAGSITELVQYLKEEVQENDYVSPRYKGKSAKYDLTYEKESAVADRIELASRILRQVKSGSSPVRKILLLPIQEAIGFLAEKGRPITQVKMMRVCQNVPEIDLIEALRKPLNEGISWVRDQALLLVASSERSARAIGSDFATEMGHDFANGLLLNRLSAYFRAAKQAGEGRYWLALAMGLFCCLTNISLLLSGAALLYVFAFKIAGWFGNPLLIFFYSAIVVLSSLLALKYESHKTLITTYSSAAGSLSLLAITFVAWAGKIEMLLVLGISIVIGFVVFLFVGGAIALVFHLFLLSIYLACTARMRVSKHNIRSFFCRSVA